MDINNLKAFIEVAERKSFSRSAETLNLTQPAVSKRIAALESELDAKLFDRVGRTVHLTEAGRVLLPSARQISSELSRIEDVICNLGEEVGGTLSIGTNEHIGTHLLPSVLREFRKNHPRVELNLTFANSNDTLQAISNGSLEIALCSLPTNAKIKNRSKLRAMEIWREKLVVVVDKTHPLASGEPVSMDLLVKCPAILPSTGSSIRTNIDDTLDDCGHEATVTIEASDFETIRSMTTIGLGWACLPNFMVNEQLAVLKFDGLALDYAVTLVRQHERTLSRAAQAFLDELPTRIT